MPITISCKCGRHLRLADKLAGKKVRCTACNKIIEVPEIPDEDSASGHDRPTKPHVQAAPVARPLARTVPSQDADDDDHDQSPDTNEHPLAPHATTVRTARDTPGKRGPGLVLLLIVFLLGATAGGAVTWYVFDVLDIRVMAPEAAPVRLTTQQPPQNSTPKELNKDSPRLDKGDRDDYFRKQFNSVMLAVLAYSEQHQQLPDDFLGKADSPLQPNTTSGLSWRVAILPFLGPDGRKLYARFQLDEPWDSPANKMLLADMPDVFKSPQPGHANPGETFVQLFTGPECPYDKSGKAPTIANSLRAGTSNVLLLAEASTPVSWTRPGDIRVEPNQPLPKLGHTTADGFYGCTADAMPHFFARDHYTDAILRQLICPSAAGPAPKEWWQKSRLLTPAPGTKKQ